MIFSTQVGSITFQYPERKCLSIVKEWFESLEDTEVKRAIRRVRWRERKPKENCFGLYVITQHPYINEALELEMAQQQPKMQMIEDAAVELLDRYAQWISDLEMPKTAFLWQRDAEISWHPVELPPSDPETLPPQLRAQDDIERHTQRLLDLVHVSALSSSEFSEYAIGKCTPFFAAGLIATGYLKMINRCPLDTISVEILHDRIFDYSADIVILLRLAIHYGCAQALVQRVDAARCRFLSENESLVRIWEEYWKLEHEDLDDDLALDVSMEPEEYMVLDSICEGYRNTLVQATEGYEYELVEVLNQFLPELPVPSGPWAAGMNDILDEPI